MLCCNNIHKRSNGCQHSSLTWHRSDTSFQTSQTLRVLHMISYAVGGVSQLFYDAVSAAGDWMPWWCGSLFLWIETASIKGSSCQYAEKAVMNNRQVVAYTLGFGWDNKPSRSFIHSFINDSAAYLLGPGLFFSFVIFFIQTVGLLGRVNSPSQGRYLHTGEHKHRINAHADTHIHALSGIRMHDHSFRAYEDSSCLRLRGHSDR
jgi:hypothetical protein